MAPHCSIADCASIRTARVKSLSIRAFKSFGADAQSFQFGRGFNLIVGPNGSGKSNILDAICFVLCAKTSTLRVGSISELQSTDTREQCEVSIELQVVGPPGVEYDPISLLVKVLPNDVRQYKVNGKLKSLKEVKELLKEHRLLLDETSAVVHQSSVTELADKNSPQKLASIISAASGAGRWNEEVEFANKELKNTRVGLEEIQENICLLESGIAEDNARLQKLLSAEKLEIDLSSASRQMYKFQMQRLCSVKDEISEKEGRVRSQERVIEEKLELIKDKRASLKKCKTITKVDAKSWNTKKFETLDAIAITEEEVLALENKVVKLKLLKSQLESLGLALESLEVESFSLQKRHEEKQRFVESLEFSCKTMGSTSNPDSGMQRYKNVLRKNIEALKGKLQNLQIEQGDLMSLLQGAERNIAQWECTLQTKQEEHSKVQHLIEACDIRAIIQLEDKCKQFMDMKRTTEELKTQVEIMNSQLGSLTGEESMVPAWPLHSCFTFRSDVEDITKYMKAMNVIAGFIKKVCVTDTRDAAAKLLQVWDKNGNVSKFCRIWPLDHLRVECDIQLQRNIQSSYSRGSVILPTDLLQYENKFEKAISRAFGNYVISLSDDVGKDLVCKDKIWNVTLDGRVNRTGSVSGGWTADEKKSYLHVKLTKDKTDQERTLLSAQQFNCEKEIKKLEMAAVNCKKYKAREEAVRKDILLAEEEMYSLKKDALRYQAQLRQCQKFMALTQTDLECSKKQWDACLESPNHGSGPESLRSGLNDAKHEEELVLEALEKVQMQVVEAQAKKSELAQKIHHLEKEDPEQIIKSKREELDSLKITLDQVDIALEGVAQEEKLQAAQIVLYNEAMDNAEKIIEVAKSEIAILKREIVQAKSDEEKIQNELKELLPAASLCQENESIESDSIKDLYGYATAKRKLQKMVADLSQLQAEQQGMSLAEQVAIKERAEKLSIFKERRTSIIDSIDILLEGIEKSKKRVQEANEVVFKKVRGAFAESCKYLLPNKLVDLVKVGKHVEDGVRFTFSNVSQGSTRVPQEWKASLGELSGGQRTLLSLAFLLTVAMSGQSPLYLMDEVDAALDEENQNRVAKLIQNIVSKGSQVICVSHHISFQQHSDTVIQVTKADGTTKLYQTYVAS